MGLTDFLSSVRLSEDSSASHEFYRLWNFEVFIICSIVLRFLLGFFISVSAPFLYLTLASDISGDFSDLSRFSYLSALDPKIASAPSFLNSFGSISTNFFGLVSTIGGCFSIFKKSIDLFLSEKLNGTTGFLADNYCY